jgi:hypothetical protein
MIWNHGLGYGGRSEEIKSLGSFNSRDWDGKTIIGKKNNK